MNYAHFYPLVLYPSGDEPTAVSTTEPEDKSQSNNAKITEETASNNPSQ